MSESENSLLQDLQSRQLIAQAASIDDLDAHLSEGSRTLYCGFDPTAESLHLGHLVPLLVLKRFQMAGHKPIALVGGATGLIGDPSFKASERQLNTSATIVEWADKIRNQVSQFIDFECGDNAALVVNNLSWFEKLSALEFLRNVGKYFSVNAMINKDSVQQRLNREGSGITFTEFSYALLQGLDFLQLNNSYGCTLQIGGSDQWGNIVGGIDLVRRQNKVQSFGLTVPLVTKTDGSKFGKTESGAIWLDPQKTSPYSFYQFWLNTSDSDVYKFMRYFTFLSIADIDAIEDADAETQGRKSGQDILAREVTKLVHGAKQLQSAERITEALFSGELSNLSQQDLEQLKQDGLPSSTLLRTELEGQPMTQLFAEVGMVKSGKQVKDALQKQAILFNGKAYGVESNMAIHECFSAEKALYGKFFLVKLGKKKHHLFEVV